MDGDHVIVIFLKYGKKIVNIWKTLTSLFATATVLQMRMFGMISIFFVRIHPVEDIDEYADLPIYERIQWLLYDLWIIQNYLSLRQ